jgi:small-conductance mechanosensitive channel
MQRALRERILPETQIDVGLQHSLTAGFGYVGFTLAAMLGISALGLDLSNIALIAGALSVGIGFGLQTIVSNFVAGLTLLIERPIKVGDWIVVGDQEGIVKRIQVRATEIETFQRNSVIVPNSEFLVSNVINRTQKDSVGRIELPIGVAYGSDTAKVEEILLGVARDNPKIAQWPEPFVLFQNFGDYSLDFELRCYCQNVFDTIRGGSELRFAIDKAFREEGIEIPFPQRDVNIKGIEKLIPPGAAQTE